MAKKDFSNSPFLELENINKYFDVTKALQNMNLNIYPGEVVGLVGPNGAGKSTLMKIITGILAPTSGNIKINGKIINDIHDPKSAQENGIACAYQDLSLCTNLTVYENFAMLNESQSLIGKPGWRKNSKTYTKAILDKFFPDNNIDVLNPVSTLSLLEKQIIEICKTLNSDKLKLLILDEPTSALSSDKARQLHKIIRKLASDGVAIIYISHKLDEVIEVSDRIVMVRNGSVVGNKNAREVTKDELVKIMGGKVIKKVEEDIISDTKYSSKVKKDLIKINNLNTKVLKKLNFYAQEGEIIGISGLAGSGQKELINYIFDSAMRTRKYKEVEINGSISYVSGDRSEEGVFPLWDISDNILISNLDHVIENGLINKSKSEKLVSFWYDKLKFKAEGIHSKIMSLSGGNQQKALIARGIASGSEIILLNDPTAGVDIETKQEIYSLLEDARAAGRTIILYSTEDLEMELCDRVYIMNNGAVVNELSKEEISVSNIVESSFKEKDELISNDNLKDDYKNNIWKILKYRMTIPLLTLFVMLAIVIFKNPRVLTYMGFEMMLSSALPLVFVSLAQMFIVVSGDIDMGNGMAMGLVNVIIALVMTNNLFIGLISLLLFIIAYIAMGALIHYRKIPAIVVTLGAQFIWLGIALILAPIPGGYPPDWLMYIYEFPFPIFPMPFVICVITAFVSYWIVKKSKYGMILRGIGNNPESVERAGWSYLAARLTNYGLASLFIILAGLSVTAMSFSADANGSGSYLMLSIATIILGGCELSGGIVEPIGTVIGAVSMSLISMLLITLNINSNLQTAITGLILLTTLTIKLVNYRGRSV